jgi:hypothetical protein
MTLIREWREYDLLREVDCLVYRISNKLFHTTFIGNFTRTSLSPMGSRDLEVTFYPEHLKFGWRANAIWVFG